MARKRARTARRFQPALPVSHDRLSHHQRPCARYVTGRRCTDMKERLTMTIEELDTRIQSLRAAGMFIAAKAMIRERDKLKRQA